jgi:hypothetical protein
MSAAFAGFALTVGFEDLFERTNVDLEQLGWATQKGRSNAWQIGDGRLEFDSTDFEESILLKNLLLNNFELTANVRFQNRTTPNAVCGFYFKQANAETVLTIERENSNYFLQIFSQNEKQKIVLPDWFAPEYFQQFRFRREAANLTLQCEKTDLGSVEIPEGQTRIGLLARNTKAEFEMIRATLI